MIWQRSLVGSAVTGTATPVAWVHAYKAHGIIILSGETWSPGAAHFRLSLESIRGRAAYGIPLRRMACQGGLPGHHFPILFQNAMPGEGIHPMKDFILPHTAEECKKPGPCCPVTMEPG